MIEEEEEDDNAERRNNNQEETQECSVEWGLQNLTDVEVNL